MQVSHVSHDSLFATTEQLQMLHLAVCQSLMQTMKVCLPQLNSYRATHTNIPVSLRGPNILFATTEQLQMSHCCMPVTHSAHDSLFATI